MHCLKNASDVVLRSGHISGVCLAEVAEPDIHMAELLLKHVVNILAVFERICEAARIAEP